MPLFHGYPSATIADKFHGRQFILTYMLRIDCRGSAEAAFCLITTGITQVSRFIGYGSAAFTRICHGILLICFCAFYGVIFSKMKLLGFS
jgi:hypothetical protein